MRRFARKAVKFLLGERGATAVEYAVLLFLFVCVCIGALAALRGQAKAQFYSAKDTIGTGS